MKDSEHVKRHVYVTLITKGLIHNLAHKGIKCTVKFLNLYHIEFRKFVQKMLKNIMNWLLKKKINLLDISCSIQKQMFIFIYVLPRYIRLFLMKYSLLLLYSGFAMSLSWIFYECTDILLASFSASNEHSDLQLKRFFDTF